MNVHGAGELSLGQWAAICRAWNKAHGGDRVEAPSRDELETAMLAVRGVRIDGH